MRTITRSVLTSPPCSSKWCVDSLSRITAPASPAGMASAAASRAFGDLQVRLPRVELFVGADGEVDRVRHVFAFHVVAGQQTSVHRVFAIEEFVAELGIFAQFENRRAELFHLLGRLAVGEIGGH